MNGKRVAHFAIAGKIGEGGMGVVYEAIDANLDRRVALKILPPDKVSDAARKARFIQEAKAASALNHPNIITIYEIGSADGMDYIAMELVSGRTLEDVLAKRRLKTAETLKIAVQIADAVAAAHAAGIVHRDLKPANVMIADGGLVKVLDFGLAKLTDSSEVSEDDATRTERALTEDGTVVGSAPYMSPEQAEGKRVDARSDIFSFGVMLYEMLSGKRAFRGETRMKTLAAVLTQEPAPLSEVTPGLPKELERVVTLCLRKDVARRSQSMAQIKLELEELKEESESGASAVSTPAAKESGPRWKWVVGGALALALCASAVIFELLRSHRPAAWKEVPLTSYPGTQGEPTLSPDASQFAFVWDGGVENGPQQLYVGLAGRGTPLKLTNTPGAAARYPAWSPDGQTIAFVRAVPGSAIGELIEIPALGGPERKIEEAVLASHVAWSPDGKWLYFTRVSGQVPAALYAEPSGGGERRRLIEPPAGIPGDRDPAVSPDGKQVAFARWVASFNADLYVADLRDGNTAGAPRRITTDQQPKVSLAWTNGGKDLVYAGHSDSNLRAIYRVRASGGHAERLAGIGDFAVDVAIAPGRNRLAYSRAFDDYNLWRMPVGGADGARGTPAKFVASTRYEGGPAYAPDGKRIAFSSDRTGVRQIWAADADGSNPVALTNFTAGVAGSPQWSPDGQTIVFDARPEGLAHVYTVKASGGATTRLTNYPAEEHLPCYSADGRWIFFSSSRSGTEQLYRIPAGGGDAVALTRNGARASIASPDGKWIYYSKHDRSVWKVPVDGGAESQVLGERTLHADLAFGVAASGIYYIGPQDPASATSPVKLYRFTDGQTVEVGRLDRIMNLRFTVSPDEKWMVWAQRDSSVADLRLVENFR